LQRFNFSSTVITISKNKTQKLGKRRLWAEWFVVPQRKTDTYTNIAYFTVAGLTDTILVAHN